MMILRRRWIVVAAILPLLLLASLILFNTGFSPTVAWAQTESGITSPAPGTTVFGAVAIVGTATSENFDRYELSYKPEPSGEDAYIYLSGGREQVVAGQLGVWQTDDLAPGQYSLRMRVVRTDGNYAEYVVPDLTVVEEEPPTPTPTDTPTAVPLPPTATPTPDSVAAQPALPPTPAVTVEAAAVVTTPVTSVEAATAITPLGSSAPISVTVVGGDEETLRTFLRSLLAAVGMGPSAGAVTATVGTLPSLPIDLDLPASIEVVGSVVRTGEFGGTQLFFAAEPPAANLAEVVREQLSRQGFTAPPAMASPGAVFLSTQPELSLLCNLDDDLYVNTGMAALGEETIILQVSLNPIRAEGGPCTVDPIQDTGPGYGILPQLAPLPDSLVQMSGGSRGGDRISANAEIQGDVTAAELAAHYENQLETAGWERVDDTAVDAIAWSVWTFTDTEDNEWDGTFYVVRRAGDGNVFVATLEAHRQR